MQDQVLMLVSTFQVYSIFSKENLNKYIYIYIYICVCVCVCVCVYFVVEVFLGKK